jgi:hypothetical protein
MAKSGHKGISRIDCPERKTVGWYVRVRLKKVTKSKFISDNAPGTPGEKRRGRPASRFGNMVRWERSAGPARYAARKKKRCMGQ